MSGEPKSDDELLKLIEVAFKDRQVPHSVVIKGHRDSDIYDDALAFLGMQWREVTCADLTDHPGAVYGFSPEAFCYYLPGIYSASIRERRPNLLVINSLIADLDRSNMPASWDEFFVVRWPKLNAKECEATQRWLLWLASLDRPSIGDARLARAFDTVTLLINQQGAIPLAAWTEKRR